MSALEKITRINQGIHQDYLYQTVDLAEIGENMIVPLSKYDNRVVAIRPKDCEKETLWACFSDEVARNIADYILFMAIDDEIVCFILELKKLKTESSNYKAINQILSTHPLVKMIYEKTTGENASMLKTIGIKVFGTGDKSQIKVSSREKRIIPNQLAKENELIAIGSFSQNRRSETLTSLVHFYTECKRIFVN